MTPTFQPTFLEAIRVVSSHKNNQECSSEPVNKGVLYHSTGRCIPVMGVHINNSWYPLFGSKEEHVPCCLGKRMCTKF